MALQLLPLLLKLNTLVKLPQRIPFWDNSWHTSPSHPSSNFSLSKIKVVENYVIYTLSDLNLWMASGPDWVPLIVLTSVPLYWCPAWSNSRFILSTSTLLSSWKYAHIQTEPEKDDCCNPRNCCPVAVLACPSKAFETVLERKVLKHFNTQPSFWVPPQILQESFCWWSSFPNRFLVILWAIVVKL